jgi:hypothetical protein
MGRSVQELLDEAFDEEVHTFKKLLQNIELLDCMHFARELAHLNTKYALHSATEQLIEVAKNVVRIEEAQENYYSSISPE